MNDLHPLVWLRVTRPLRDDSKLDLINLSAFYEQTNHFGLSVNVTPDYGFEDAP